MFSVVNYWDQYNISHCKDLKQHLSSSSVHSSSAWLTPGHIFLSSTPPTTDNSPLTDETPSDESYSHDAKNPVVELSSFDTTAYTPIITVSQTEDKTRLKTKFSSNIVEILKFSSDNEFLIVSGTGQCEVWFYNRKTKCWLKCSEISLNPSSGSESDVSVSGGKIISAVLNNTTREVIWCSEISSVTGDDNDTDCRRCNIYRTRFTKDESGCVSLMEAPKCLIRNMVENCLYNSTGGTVIWSSSMRLYVVIVAGCVNVFDALHHGFLFSENLATHPDSLDFTDILIRAARICVQSTDKQLPLCCCLSKPGNFFHFVDSEMSLYKINKSGEVQLVCKLPGDISASWSTPTTPAGTQGRNSYNCFIMTFVVGVLFDFSIIRMFDVKSGNLLQVFNFRKREIPHVRLCRIIGQYPIVGFKSTSGVWTLKMQSLSQVLTVCEHTGVDTVNLLQKCNQKHYSKHVLMENLHNYCQKYAIGDTKDLDGYIHKSGEISKIIEPQTMSMIDKILLTAVYQESKGILPARIQTDIHNLIKSSPPDYSSITPQKMRDYFLKFWAKNNDEYHTFERFRSNSSLLTTIETITRDDNHLDFPSNRVKLELLAEQQPLAVLDSLCKIVGFSQDTTGYYISSPNLLVYSVNGRMRFNMMCRMLYTHRPRSLVGFVSCVQMSAQYSHIQSAFTNLSQTMYYDRAICVLPTSQSEDSIRAKAQLLIKSSRKFPHSEAMDLYLHNGLWTEGIRLLTAHRHVSHIANELYYKLLITACQRERLSEFWEVIWALTPEEISYSDVIQVLGQYLAVKVKPHIFVSDTDNKLTVGQLRTKLLQSIVAE